MAIVGEHKAIWRELFARPGFLSSPILCVGRQAVWPECHDEWPDPILRDWLRKAGYEAYDTDLHDTNVSFVWDLNRPLKRGNTEYRTVLDIGTLEHVADCQQALENDMAWTAVGGRLLIHTPICGYLGHGLHTHSPEWLVGTLLLNGFELEWFRVTTADGGPARLRWSHGVLSCTANSALMWIVAVRTRRVAPFMTYQQDGGHDYAWLTGDEDVA